MIRKRADERAGAGGVAPVPGEDGGPEGAVYSAGAAHKSPEVTERPRSGTLCGGRGPVYGGVAEGLCTRLFGTGAVASDFPGNAYCGAYGGVGPYDAELSVLATMASRLGGV